MEETDYMELFGLNAEDTGENGGDNADPTPDADTDEGANNQDFADPDDSGTADNGNSGDDNTDNSADNNNADNNSANDNAKYAAARRKAEAERDRAVAEAKAQAQKMVDDVIANSNLLNRHTGQPIRTKAELDEYNKQNIQYQQQRFLQDTGMDETEFNSFVDNLPEVQQAKQAAAEAERIKRETEIANAKDRITTQVKEIAKLEPTIKSIDDVFKLETYPKMNELMKRGYTLADAYKLTHFEQLQNRTGAQARQSGAQAAQSKAHLNATRSRGAGGIDVPSNVIAEYRMFNPKATNEEIRAHYAKAQARRANQK